MTTSCQSEEDALSSESQGRGDEAALLVADLYELAGLLRQSGEELAATRGQTQARWQLLSVISEEPFTVAQAARRLGITRQAVQRVANELAADGLAEFAENPEHRTSRLLTLTESGRKTLAEITQAASVFNRQLAEALGDREMTAARRSVRKLVESLRRR
jgi:DNA-binding MarR family transcriptional regulator